MRWIPALVLLTVPSVSFAKKPKPIFEIDAKTVAAMATDNGASAEITVDSAGDPLVNVRSSSLNYQVLFYNCEGDAASAEKSCSSLQFRAWWTLDAPVDPALLMQYEIERRIGRAYLDTDQDPTLEVNVWLDGGVTLDHLKWQHDTFLRGAQEFSSRLAGG